MSYTRPCGRRGKIREGGGHRTGQFGKLRGTQNRFVFFTERGTRPHLPGRADGAADLHPPAKEVAVDELRLGGVLVVNRLQIVEVPLQEDSCRRHAAEEQAPCAEPSVEENFHATRLAIWRARSAVGTRSPGSGTKLHGESGITSELMKSSSFGESSGEKWLLRLIY